MRRSANRAAVIVAPVEPALTSACERPSATSAAARTTDAPGVAAHRGDRVVVVGDLVRCLEHLDAVHAPQRRQLLRVPEHAHADPVGRRGAGAGDDHLTAPVDPAAVQGDGCAQG